MIDDRLGGERGAMAADADEHIREARFGRPGEIDDLGHVRQIVAAKGDHIGPPACQRAEIGALAFDLQVEEPHRMSGLARRTGDDFETDRLEPQKNLRIGKRAGMDAEHAHTKILPFAVGASRKRPHTGFCRLGRLLQSPNPAAL